MILFPFEKRRRNIAMGDQGNIAIPLPSVVVESSVLTFGCNDDGQLGRGEKKKPTGTSIEGVTSSNQPQQVGALRGLDIVMISCGSRHTVALSTTGDVYTWGWGQMGQLGLEHHKSINLPTKVPFFEHHNIKLTYVSAGGCHSGAITDQGQVYMWGEAHWGQLGLTADFKELHQATPVLCKVIPENSTDKIVSLSCGASPPLTFQHFLTRSTVLGLGREWFHLEIETDGVSAFTPTRIEPEAFGLEDVVQVSAGAFHTAAVTASGAVYTWGKEDYGMLGVGHTADIHVPRKVDFFDKDPARIVSCGGWHTVVVTRTGAAYVFGRGEYGRLGLGDGRSHSHPHKVESLAAHTIVDASAGTYPLEEGRATVLTDGSVGGTHTLFLTDKGRAFSCGRTEYVAEHHPSVPNEHDDDTPRQDEAVVVESESPRASTLRRRNSSDGGVSPASPRSPTKSAMPQPTTVSESTLEDDDDVKHSPDGDAAAGTSDEAAVAVALHSLEDPNGNLHIRILDLNGKVFSVSCSSDWSVDQLHAVVEAKSGVDAARQRLIYRGRVLDGDSSLGASKVEDGHTIHLFVRQVAPLVPETTSSDESEAALRRLRELEDHQHRVIHFHSGGSTNEPIRSAVFPSESARRMDPILQDSPLGMAARRVKLWASFVLIIHTMKLLGQCAFLANFAAQNAAGMNDRIKKELQYTPLYDETSAATVGKLAGYAFGVYVGCVGFKAAHDTDVRPARQYIVGMIALGMATMAEQVYEILRFSAWDPEEYRKARSHTFAAQSQPSLDEMVRSYVVQTFLLALMFLWAVKHAQGHRDELAAYNETVVAAAMSAVPLPPLDALERTPRGVGEQSIMKRRNREDSLSMYTGVVKGLSHMNARADWETKLHDKAGVRDTLNVLKTLKNQDESNLASRRLKLATLMNAEMDAWKQMCLHNVESPEERKQKMIARATELKTRREAARKAFVEEKRQQQYRESCDDNRTLESAHIVAQVVQDRDKQLEERQRILEEEKAFEARMAELWAEDKAKKDARDKADVQRILTNNHEVKTILDVQVSLIHARQAEEAAIKEQEDRDLLATWKLHEQIENELDAEIKRKAVARAMDVKKFNQTRSDLTERQARREHEYDTQLLQLALRQEAETDARERALQEKFKRDQLEYQAMLRKQMATEAEDLSYLDAIRKKMEDEVWAKRDAEHRAEDDARQELLAQVLQSRQDQMERKELRKAADAAADAAYMARMQRESDEALQKELTDQDKRKWDAKRNQVDVVAQKAQTKALMEKQKQTEFLDMKRMALSEKQHKLKLAQLATQQPTLNFRRKTSEWYFDT
ncbi:hypothetical protein DYB35_001640 [Aphanomyces astaci]|uniref:Ubiquitin-like domain-containing protein n=1 Tax=Aphanomyces astaci TaxID=112090 RepID=A0A3R6XTP1_APHAT|nr:hypothetical protein DYB35_001640 [Aphanomyces astaci]